MGPRVYEITNLFDLTSVHIQVDDMHIADGCVVIDTEEGCDSYSLDHYEFEYLGEADEMEWYDEDENLIEEEIEA